MEIGVLAPRSGAPRDAASRIEIAVLLAVLAVGLAVRLWKLPDLGLTHFDEGVYALSARGLTDPTQGYRLFPSQAKFAPLVFPVLVAAGFRAAGGASDTAACLVSIVLGSATILVVWAIGRRWFGRSAGLAAAVLVALNDFHILLSRSVLTDVTFSLAFLLALAAAVRACERQTIGSAVLAGLLVGVAWNTKYHGWLAVVVVAGAAVLLYASGRQSRRPSFRGLVRTLVVVAGVAALCYLPWALYVNAQPGGYLALMKYQKTMLSRQWWANLQEQALLQWALDGALSRMSIVAALVAAALVAPRRALTPRWILLGAIAASAALLAGGMTVCVALALCAIPGLVERPMRLSAAACLAWVALWFVVTPLYRPFARLVLPFTIGTILLAAKALSPRDGRADVPAGARHAGSLALAAGAGLLLIALAFRTSPMVMPPASPDVRQAVAGIVALVPADSVIAVVAEPDVEFYLQLAHRRVVRFEESDAAMRAPYLVSGFYGTRSPRLRSRIAALRDRLVPVTTFHVVPAPMRLVDDLPAGQVRDFRNRPDERFDLTLFRLSSPPPSQQ